MEMRREPFKVSLDSVQNTDAQLGRLRRKSMSCTRLAPAPQPDIEIMRTLATPKAFFTESPTGNRAESPELDTSLNTLGMKKPNKSIANRKTFFTRSLKTRKTFKSDHPRKERNSWFNPKKWVKKIKGENGKFQSSSLRENRRRVVQLECSGSWN